MGISHYLVGRETKLEFRADVCVFFGITFCNDLHQEEINNIREHITYKKVKCNSTKNYSHLSVISAILHSSLFNRSHSVAHQQQHYILCC